jgi:tetratricopeptide (TPR) repeat protein
MEGSLIAGAKTAEDALKMNKRFFGHSGLPLVATYVEAGVLQLYAGDSGQAGKAALKGLAILKKHGLTATDPNTSRLLDTLGRALELRGRTLPEKKARPLFKAALAALTKAVHLDLKQVGCDHPKYGTHRANQASAQWALGDLVGAEAGFREAIRIYEEILCLPEHPNLVDAYANLGSVLTQATRNDDAEVALQKALALNEKARGPDDTLVGNDHANLGRLYFRNGDCERAQQEFRKALDIYALNVRNRRLPKDHPYIQEARDWLARPCP